MVLCMGIASAALVMVGNQIGMGEPNTARRYSRKFTVLSVAIGILLGAALFACAPFVLTFFEISDEAAGAAITILRIFGVILTARMINTLAIIGIFRGGGDASYALRLEASTMWLIGVPLAVIGACVLRLPVEQVVLLVSVEEITKCGLVLWRLKSGKWLHSMEETAGSAEVSAPSPEPAE